MRNLFSPMTAQLLTGSHPQLLVLTISEYVGLKQIDMLLKTVYASTHTQTFMIPNLDTIKCSIVFSCS